MRREELRPGDLLVLGHQSGFWAWRQGQRPGWWGLDEEEQSRRLRQVSYDPQGAMHYMSILQGQNLDSTGMQCLEQFFLAAKRASALVSEALIRVF